MPQGQGARRAVVSINRAAILSDMIGRGWTQRELARRARLTEMQVSRLLTGAARPPAVAAAVARALRQPVDRYVTVDVDDLQKTA